MGIIDNKFSVNIQKLFLEGNIAKAYEKMYNTAERITIHELKLHQSNLVHKYGTNKVQGRKFNLLEEV